MRIPMSLLLCLGMTACGPVSPGSLGESAEASTQPSGSAGSSGSGSETQGGGSETQANGSETSSDSEQPGPDENVGGGSFLGDGEDTRGLWGGCDPFAQDCPRGEKCVPYASDGDTWDDNKCVPVTGELGEGESCFHDGVELGSDNCDATSVCWDLREIEGEEDARAGVCRSFCTGIADEPQCESVEDSCLIAYDGSVNLCLDSCDPLTQDCEGGLGCYWGGDDFLCLVGSDIPVGEPCVLLSDCQVGHECISAEVIPECVGSACCTPFCALDDPNAPCEVLPGTSCIPFFEDGFAPPGAELIGVCAFIE